MRSLIIGGTSGLGLEIAKILKTASDEVIITGRKNPGIDGLQFQKFDLDIGYDLPKAVEVLVTALPQIDRLVYAAGFYQEGTLDQLDPLAISSMLDVGINAPIWFIRELLKSQTELAELVAITSTSQWTPRAKEPVYTAVKAALGMLANSLADDGRIGKVLVAGPGGMKTKFWENTGRDISKDNDPSWVAKQIVDALSVDFTFASVKVLRDPPRTEIVETR